MTTLYGIPNCDTMKKARRWLDANGIAYDFHDYKKAGIDRETLKHWCDKVGFETLLNTRGTTWRKLDDTRKQHVNSANAIALMAEHPSMIKRPVLVAGHQLLVGFDEPAWKSLL